MSALTPTGISCSTTKPRWVLHDGALRHVSDFAALPPKQRPQTICPLCEDPVTLKLGKIRAHHYAHAHNCDCAATRPETALHLNAKFHFYRELQSMIGNAPVELHIEQWCQGKGCKACRKWVWARDWEAVEVEYRMDSLRPDIALFRAGEVVAAIEILVTHAVNERKAAHFQEQEVPWAEIAATESLYEGNAAWKADTPLPATRHHPRAPDWICPDCERKELERRQQIEVEAKRREYERLNHTETYVDRMVDFFFPTSENHREIFEVQKIVRDGREAQSLLRSQRRGVLCSVDGKLTQETLDQFTEMVEAEIEDLVITGTIVDDVLPWRRVRKGSHVTPRNPMNFPFKYHWRGDQNAWVEGAEPVAAHGRFSSSPTTFQFKSGQCIACGRVTDDWYYRHPQGHCHCNDCLRKQKS